MKAKTKHIKLWEQFSKVITPIQSSIITGYWGEDGIGSHPTLVDLEGLATLNKVASDMGVTGFTECSKLESMPETLLCILCSETNWYIKGVSKSIADQAISIMNGDNIILDEGTNNSVKSELFSLLGYTLDPTVEKYFTTYTVTIINNPSINTVYWSNVPEEQHGYWIPPYTAINVNDIEGRIDEPFGFDNNNEM